MIDSDHELHQASFDQLKIEDKLFLSPALLAPCVGVDILRKCTSSSDAFPFFHRNGTDVPQYIGALQRHPRLHSHTQCSSFRQPICPYNSPVESPFDTAFLRCLGMRSWNLSGSKWSVVCVSERLHLCGKSPCAGHQRSDRAVKVILEALWLVDPKFRSGVNSIVPDEDFCHLGQRCSG